MVSDPLAGTETPHHISVEWATGECNKRISGLVFPWRDASSLGMVATPKPGCQEIEVFGISLPKGSTLYILCETGLVRPSMSLRERLLPLFPLNTVLIPNTSLPLQIFEERYKLMLQHCLDGDSRFGVVLIESGSEVGDPAKPFSTGTVAHISDVKRLEGDRLLISVTGEQRFQIKNITQYRPYMTAQVELLEDDSEVWVPPTEMEAIRQAAAQHIRLVLGLRGGWVREPRMPKAPVALSYFIAGILQVTLAEKQTLLEEPSTPKRLEAELDLLRREAEGLKIGVARELRRRYGRQ